MTTTRHTPIATRAAATAATLNAPLSQLDTAVVAVEGDVSQLFASVGSGAGWASTLDAQALLGQKVVPVASTTGAIAGMPIYIGLTSGTHEVGVIDTISAGVSVTLLANLASTYAAGTPISATPAEVADARGGYATLGAKARSWALDVKDYGPTGTADDTTTVQAWLDAVVATGRPGYLSDGAYIVNPLTITTAGTIIGLTIFGAGRDKSTLQAKAGAGDLLTLTGSFRAAHLHDFGIDGTGGTGHGLYYAETTGYLYESSLERLVVKDCAKNGIYIKSSFANRYAGLSLNGNGWNQMKVWGGPGDAYERIDIESTVAGYGGIRAINGGVFTACNGIYDTANAAGPMFKFGGDGSADSDSLTAYPAVEVHASNVESFTGTGILFVQSPRLAAILDSVTWAVAPSAVNARAVDMLVGSVQTPLILRSPSFTTTPVSWANGAQIHGDLPVVLEGGYNGVFPAAYRDGVGAYDVAHRALGVYNANTATYLHRPARLMGYTDIGYLASARIGEVGSSANYVDRTASPAMPTNGTYRRGDIVDNCNHAITEQGSGGSKYTLTGWRRLTDGSAHVLNTDWVERRELTGN